MSKARPKAVPRAVALAEVKDDFSKYLRLAADEEILATRHGQPAGVLIGFASEDDWFEYRPEHHPEFLRRVAQARAAIRDGRGVPLEEVEPTAESITLGPWAQDLRKTSLVRGQNVGTIWEQLRPNTGKNGGIGLTRKQDESTT
jgi:prevent-host-death family protein